MDDFKDRKTFPGTEGGPFDLLIRFSESIERIPMPIFTALLIVIAWLVSGFGWAKAFPLVAFFLGDWFLLSLLPKIAISFGPAKPQTLTLIALRLPLLLLPGWWMWAAQGAGTCLLVYGFYIEPQWLDVTWHQLDSPRMADGSVLRIVHFGDLHLNRFRRIDKRLLRTIHAIGPDIILFSGDVLSYSSVNDPKARCESRKVFKMLQAPLGIYAVPGSPPVDRPEVTREVFTGTKVQLLDDQKVTLHHQGSTIEVIGVRCSHRPFVDGPKLDPLSVSSENAFKVLLYHSPDLAPCAAKLGIDLQMSGHTHGGQVRLPLFGALYASSLYGKRFEAGRHQIGNLTLFVTRGIGLEGAGAPRVRFLCRPEVAVWEISSH